MGDEGGRAVGKEGRERGMGKGRAGVSEGVQSASTAPLRHNHHHQPLCHSSIAVRRRHVTATTEASIQLTTTNEAAAEAEVAESCQCYLKRAVESLEKLLDVTREELPDTMAAIRLSEMEISDLTMELSDLGQEITQGVRSSTRAVRVAEERIRDLTNINQAAPMQDIEIKKKVTTEPMVAKTARIMRDGVVKGHGLLRMLFTISRLSRFVVKYFVSRAKKKP
ncbi:hypothetical protein Drorol1_Dr00008419 [Drosera rotundifolia]